MIRIPRWLFVIMLPACFFGGCFASLRPVWALTERAWIRPVAESEISRVPVLVRSASSGFSVAQLGDIPPDTALVTDDFDETAINNDLNASIGSTEARKYFRLLERTSAVTRVTLEVPTRRDVRFQSWYDIRDRQVMPQKMMAYGPGFAFVVLPLSIACGMATMFLFSKLVRLRGRNQEATDT